MLLSEENTVDIYRGWKLTESYSCVSRTHDRDSKKLQDFSLFLENQPISYHSRHINCY